MTRSSAAFFDLDKTLISRSSTLAFSRPFYRDGLISRAAMIRVTFAQAVFQRAGAGPGRMERIRVQAGQLCRGWQAERVREIVRENLDEIIVPHLYAEARALFSGHREAGRDIIVVSASGHEVVDPIAALLGADTVIATQMVITDGRYTGDFASYAYGDSITDLPMLEAVGHPTAVNPDRALRRAATQRAWPVLSFASPTAG